MEDIIREKFPDLTKRLEAFDGRILTLTLSWLMNMYISVLPIPTVVRVWDIVLLEGDKVLLKIAVGLISLNEKHLLSIEDDGDLAYAFKYNDFLISLCRQIGILQFNVDELFDLAFKSRNFLTGGLALFPYTRNEIQELRRKKRRELDSVSVSQQDSICIIDSDEDWCVC